MKRIRLTESDLHQIIKESVKKCLNELDWKTYSSAADEAKRRANGYPEDSYRRKFELERAYNFNHKKGQELDKKRERNYRRTNAEQEEYINGGYRYDAKTGRWILNPNIYDTNDSAQHRAYKKTRGYRDKDGIWHRSEYVENE